MKHSQNQVITVPTNQLLLTTQVRTFSWSNPGLKPQCQLQLFESLPQLPFSISHQLLQIIPSKSPSHEQFPHILHSRPLLIHIWIIIHTGARFTFLDSLASSHFLRSSAKWRLNWCCTQRPEHSGLKLSVIHRTYTEVSSSPSHVLLFQNNEILSIFREPTQILLLHKGISDSRDLPDFSEKSDKVLPYQLSKCIIQVY